MIVKTDPLVGTLLGDYRIEALLGVGGMGRVYLATRMRMGQQVALKVLDPALAEDQGFRARFEREWRLAASLNHPNVIPIFDAGEVDGRLYLAMLPVAGEDLAGVLGREGSLPADRTLEVLGQVAGALDAAHARGLVHRDVKPANILIAPGQGREEGDHVYLADFGLTKKAGSQSQLTRVGTFVGTLNYAAPEQFGSGQVGPPADIYALGCVLYQCLTGHVPFETQSDAQLMYMHLAQPLSSVRVHRPALPPEIDAVIARATAKDPAARTESARAVIREARAAMRLTPAAVAAQAPTRVLEVERVPPLSDPGADKTATFAIADTQPTVGQPVGRGSGISRVLVGVGAIAVIALLALAVVIAVPGMIGGASPSPGTTRNDTAAGGGSAGASTSVTPSSPPPSAVASTPTPTPTPTAAPTDTIAPSSLAPGPALALCDLVTEPEVEPIIGELSMPPLDEGEGRCEYLSSAAHVFVRIHEFVASREPGAVTVTGLGEDAWWEVDVSIEYGLLYVVIGDRTLVVTVFELSDDAERRDAARAIAELALPRLPAVETAPPSGSVSSPSASASSPSTGDLCALVRRSEMEAIIGELSMPPVQEDGLGCDYLSSAAHVFVDIYDFVASREPGAVTVANLGEDAWWEADLISEYGNLYVVIGDRTLVVAIFRLSDDAGRRQAARAVAVHALGRLVD